MSRRPAPTVPSSRRPAAAGHRRRRATEVLEGRLLRSVSQDANGYTVVTPSADSKVIYLSSSTGNDANSGLSPSAPIATIAHAENLLVSGMPDEILMKRGDVFHGYFQNWYYSGRSASEPMLIGAYGTGARPEVDCGTNTAAFLTIPGSEQAVNYVDVIGVGFDPLYRDPTSASYNPSMVGGTDGFRFYTPGGNVLIEDCSFSYFKINIDLEGGGTNFTVRRDVVTDAYNLNAHAQGMYCDNVSDVTVTQCVFDHNGWLANLAGSQQGFNHDMYFSAATSDMTVQDNVIAEASFSGVMARSGGDIDNNLFVNDPVAVVFGDANGADSTPGGVVGSLLNNVVVGNATFDGGNNDQGFEIGNTRPGAGLMVSGNDFTDTEYTSAAITLTMATATLTPAVAVGENDVTIQDNVFNGYTYTVMVDGRFVPGGTGLYGLTDVKILNNDLVNATHAIVRFDGLFDPTQETVQGNRYYSPGLAQLQWARLDTDPIGIAAWLAAYDTTGSILSALPYADPTRGVPSYDATQGGPGTLADFVAQAELISPLNYRPQYMADAVVSYVHAGYATDTTAPTATAVAPAVGAAAAGATTYTVAVTYADDFFLNAATIGANDVLVTGPNGFSQVATLVSAGAATVTTTGGQQVVATYQITPPGGAWAVGQDGTYTISLLPGAVADAAGNLSVAATLATFAVDLTPPAAVATAPAVTAAGGTSESITVAYTDAGAGVDATSLDSNQVLVTGPNGYSQYAALTAVTTSGRTVTATYAVTPADGAWSTADNGLYTVALAGDPVRDLARNVTPAGVLTSFTVAVPGAPIALPTVGSISGYAYVDANANGTYDAREVPLAGTTVFLDLAGTGKYAPGDPTVVTGADGSYSFAGLAAGRYAVVAVPPAGYVATSTASVAVTLAAGATVANIDFGEQVAPVSVSSGTPQRPVVVAPIAVAPVAGGTYFPPVNLLGGGSFTAV